MNSTLPSNSPFRTGATRSPFNLDAPERPQVRKPRAAAGTDWFATPAKTATPFYTTPTVRLLETSLGLTPEQVERLFEVPPVRPTPVVRTAAHEAQSAYRWFEFSGLTLMIVAVGYAVGALLLG